MSEILCDSEPRCPWYEQEYKREGSYGPWYYNHFCMVNPIPHLRSRSNEGEKAAPRACRHHPAYREQVEG